MAANKATETTTRQAKIHSCLNILRKTPPGDVEENVIGLASLLSADEDAVEELYQRSDPPLGHANDAKADGRRAFIISDYNRDGNSYRSPWTNNYYPPSSGGDGVDAFQPPTWLRQIEIAANQIFDSYRSIYYGDGSISSVYLWDRSSGSGNGGSTSHCGEGFAGAFLIKKEVKDDAALKSGSWNSIHVVEVNPSAEGRTASYGITTTIRIDMDPSAGNDDNGNNTNIAGSMTRRTERICSVSPGDDKAVGNQHIANIGTIIEDVEIDLRSTMDSLSIQKTRYVVDSIRSSGSDTGASVEAMSRGAVGVVSNQHKVATMLTEAVLARQLQERK